MTTRTIPDAARHGWIGFLALLTGALVALEACGGGQCIPGASASCSCPDGSKGAQVCNSHGTSFGACKCGSGSGNSTGGGPSGPSGSSTGSNTGSSSSGESTALTACQDYYNGWFGGGACASCVQSSVGPCTQMAGSQNCGPTLTGCEAQCGGSSSVNNAQNCPCIISCLGSCQTASTAYYACEASTCASECGTSSGSSGGSTVCYASSQAPLCSCASSQDIGNCSINASYGSQTGSCSGFDCCQTDQGGTCCDCASSSYLATLGLDCPSWIQQSGGSAVSSCP